MLKEIEVRFRIREKKTACRIEDRCRMTAAIPVKHYIRDEYYDTLDRQLRSVNLTVRIRKTSNSTILVVKGPNITNTYGFRHRIELELEVTNYDSLLEQLTSKELVMNMVIEKVRTEYVIDKCNIAIDEIPFIGSFVEIEGPNTGAIDMVRKQLELSDSMIVIDSYRELLEKELKSIGFTISPTLVVTFEAEDRYKTHLRYT